MRTLRLVVALALLAACPSTGGAPPAEGVGTPAPINCVSGVAQQAIADAQVRAINVISEGVASNAVESVIFNNLAGLAVNLIPGALECALQYLGVKLSYDADHATGPVAKQKMAEAKIARGYLRANKITFATPAPN